MDRLLSCSDKVLFEAIASGDEPAFRALFERYRERVYASAYKWIRSHHAAEEITQELFIRLWVGHAGLQEVQDPAAYIFRAVANRVKDYLRNDGNRDKILQKVREWQPAFSDITEETIAANCSRQLILEAVDRLTSQKRSIYRMNREEGKSIKEIANELHLSPNTVKTHLYEAIRVIRNHLKKAVLLLML